MTLEATAAPSGPSIWYRWRSAARGARLWLARKLLDAVVLLSTDSNIISHARFELRKSLAEPKDSPNRWMADDLLQLLAVFSMHGHSGFSASYTVSAFTDLARFQPLGPLTGEPDEWNEVGEGVFQNRRCSHVFKQADRFNGQAYDLDGRIFREPSGACFTNSDSFVPITFPYTPKREYVDVPASEG